MQMPETQPYGGRREKREKMEKDEKSEKSTGGDWVAALAGGLVLIWLGVSYSLEQRDYLPGDLWWAYFLVGVGVILLLQGLVMYGTGRRGLGPITGGAVAIAVGIAFIENRQADLWPVLLVILGIAVIIAGISSRRRVPTP
jgi:hypothetical protein